MDPATEIPAPKLVEAWFRSLVQEWRAARACALPEVALEADRSIRSLAAPLQTIIILDGDQATGSKAAAFVLLRDPRRRDGAVRVVRVAGTSQRDTAGHPLRIARSLLAEYVANMSLNWYPGRPVVPGGPHPRWEAFRLQDGRDTGAWIVAGDPTGIDIDEYVASCFTVEAGSTGDPMPKPHAGEPQLWAVKRRSDVGMQRWLEHHASALFRALGVTGPFWCGMNLRRREVFGAGNDGDVDIIGGPLTWDIDPASWAKRIEAIVRTVPPTAHHSHAEERACQTAAADGHIEWPPRLDRLVACEAVASYYDSDADQMKRTLVDEMHRVEGQLRLLDRYGVDRISALHIIATRPGAPTGAHPWFQATDEAMRALDAVQRLGDLAIAHRPARAGFFRIVMAAVGDLSERTAGSGMPLDVIRAAGAPCGDLATVSDWRQDELAPRLARLPNPRSSVAYIRRCDACGDWYWSPWQPFGACPCATLRCPDGPEDGERPG